MRACAEETNLHPPMARALFERCITSYIAAPHFRCCRRHRITDAGMRLDRAGGGAASGEGERLPGRFSLFSFFYKRKREVTVIQKAVADNQLHGRKRGNKETSWLRRKREYTGKVNERYRQREVCGRSNLTPSPLCEQHTLSPCARALRNQVCTHNGSGII